MHTREKIRPATTRDRSYVEHLAKKFTHEVGFIPREAIQQRLIQGNVWLALQNGQPAGYLLGAAALHGARHIRPIFQAAVQMDAQRRRHGLQLLELLSAAALKSSQSMLQCYCRQNLDANAFWKAAGFVRVALRDVNAKRGEPCILWRKPLVRMTAETLSILPPNARNQSGGGRSVSRFNWSQLPLITPFSADDVAGELAAVDRAA